MPIFCRSFLRNYKLTGKAVGMNKERILVALHKQRYIFPVGLTVTKSVQGDQGTVYVGVFRAIADDVSKASVFLTSAGLMLAANRGFLDMFGFNQNEIQGKNIRFIASQPELMEKEVRRKDHVLAHFAGHLISCNLYFLMTCTSSIASTPKCRMNYVLHSQFL